MLHANRAATCAGSRRGSPPTSVRAGCDRLQLGAETAWRERPRSVAADVIGTPVTSRGRSRHDTCFERAVEQACPTQAAKSAALADDGQLADPVEVVKPLCGVRSRAH